jgi:hypothetical protein
MDVLLGRHKTEHPLDLKWRWMHWRRLQERRRLKLF